MTEVRITCINKDSGNNFDPHEAISHYGWLNPVTNETGRANRSTMVSWLEIPGNYAYVLDWLGNKTYCKVMQRNGNKFLQTIADGRTTDNLLSLPTCR
jgi:hypothetical protein